MKIDTKIRHTTEADGNVFKDLGFDDDQADLLLAEADRIVDIKLALKAKMMMEIEDWMSSASLRQVEAASILGVTRPRVSDVVRRKMDKFTLDALVDMVARTGKRVDLQFTP